MLRPSVMPECSHSLPPRPSTATHADRAESGDRRAAGVFDDFAGYSDERRSSGLTRGPVSGAGWSLTGFLLVVWSFLGPASALAQAQVGQIVPNAPAEKPTPSPGQVVTPSPPPSAPGFWQQSNLLDSPFGIRDMLNKHGLALGIAESDEGFGNVSGGYRQSITYDGLAEFTLNLDTQKAFGLAGGSARASALQIRGQGLSGKNLGNLNTVTGIEAQSATRLFELWYQQNFYSGNLSIRAGQQRADLEFMASGYAGLFVNASFGWPTLVAEDLASDAAAYPLATLGVRVRGEPTPSLTLLGGVFNGNDRSHGNLIFGSGVLAIAEAQYSINQGNNNNGAAGTYKVGVFYDTNAFTQQYILAPQSQTSRPGFPIPESRGDWGAYGIIDQLILQNGALSGNGGLGFFVRAMGAPGNHNLVNIFVDAGLTYRGIFGRAQDRIGIGAGWARVNYQAQQPGSPASAPESFHQVRSSETVLELTYQAQIAPWWLVQPDVQYIINPGGGLSNPTQPGHPSANAIVLGLLTSVTF